MKNYFITALMLVSLNTIQGYSQCNTSINVTYGLNGLVDFTTAGYTPPLGWDTYLMADFGDGFNGWSSSNSISHTYASNGNFNANIVAYYQDPLDSNNYCLDTIDVPVTVTNVTITVTPCNALYYAYEDSLIGGLYWIVDQSSGGTPPYSYLWDFGDGNTSTLQYPTHTYAVPGIYNVCLTITDAQTPPCTSTYCDSIDARDLMYQINVFNPNVSGIDPIVEEDFNLYPNPVSDYLILNAGENYGENILISIINVAGQMLQSKKYSNNGNITIGLEELSNGVYFLRVEDGSKLATKKFIKN